MKILALDVGTGTQDILLFDSDRRIENCIKMVMPAPTVIAAQRIGEVTAAGTPLALTGVNMGGGPVTGAAQRHLDAGLPIYTTVEAATTFDDDMEMVKAMGVSLVSEDEIASIGGAGHVELKDLDLEMVRGALGSFSVQAEWDALAVAVFDHGNAPPGYSDRKFRFDHLRTQAREGRLTPDAMSYLRDEIPEYMTRMLAVAGGVGEEEALLPDGHGGGRRPGGAGGPGGIVRRVEAGRQPRQRAHPRVPSPGNGRAGALRAPYARSYGGQA